MGLRTLLIADSSEVFLLALTEVLRQRYHVLCCRDGKHALDLLRSEKCDMIVLDLMLPELDGISLLEQAIAEGVCPTVLAVTPLLNPYVIQSAERLGIGYLVRKPCDIHAIAARIEDLSQALPRPAPEPDDRRFVSELLLSLGLSTKHKGYSYLLEAILRAAKDPGQAFTKVLYPAIGKQFNRSGDQVERSIRSALDAAWKHHDDAIWQQFFPLGSKRPTSAVVITRLAEVLRQRE